MAKRLLSVLLAITMAFSLVLPVSAQDVPEENEAYQEILEMGEISGLYGFEEAGITFDSEDMISIIVMLNHKPAAVEEALQKASGISMVRATGFSSSFEDLAAKDKADFKDDLAALFTKPTSVMSPIRPTESASSPSYEIHFEYDTAINGTALVVPANKIPEILEIESVAAVFFDQTHEMEDDGFGESLDLAAINDAVGLATASNKITAMGYDIPLAHAQSVTGKGVIVGVIDSGGTYTHPDLKDAYHWFNTMDEVPQLWKERVHYVEGKYVYYGVNVFDMQYYPNTNAPHPWPEIRRTPDSGYTGIAVTQPDGSVLHNSGVDDKGLWDPFETTAEESQRMINAGYSHTARGYHGTHVSGTIVARGVGTPYSNGASAVGVAPEAKLINYKIGTPSGDGSDAAVIKALELGIADGVKVFNYSYGFSYYPYSVSPLALALNYAILTHDVIFCKSAGNSGSSSRTMGGPMAPLAFIIGNSTYTGLNANLKVGDTTYRSSLSYTNRSTEFTPILDSNNKEIAWVLDGPNAIANADYSHDFFILPQREGGPGAYGVAAGVVADWEAVGREAVEGKIVVTARGADTTAIATLIANAANNGAAGLLIINPQSGGSSITTSWATGNTQMVATYVPTFVMSYGVGMGFVDAVKTNDLKATFSSFNGNGLYGLSSGSSRGPIDDASYLIAPDIITPGSSIWSTYPYHSAATGYAAISGTSMASPFAAGLCALVLSKDLADNNEFTLKPHAVKARIANTADKAVLASQSYAVNEIGAGAPHISKALNATSYVTVNYDNVAVLTTNKIVEDRYFEYVTGERTSFSFQAGYVGAEAHTRTLIANLYNTADVSKTFNVSHIMQTTSNSSTQNVKSNGKIQPTYPATVSIEPGSNKSPQKVSFEVNLDVPETVVADFGSHEGYIILTNAADPDEVYHLPWAIFIENSQPEWYTAGLESGEFIISNFTELRQLSNIVRGAGGGNADLTTGQGPGFRDQFEGKTVKLGANITALNLNQWRYAIGTPEYPFKGTFDGNGYSITFTRTGTSIVDDGNRGLFGHVQDATLKNITIAGGTLTCYQRSAAIVGQVTVTPGKTAVVENCVNRAAVTGFIEQGKTSDLTDGAFNGTQVGGIVGLANVADAGTLIIKDCTNYGNVTGMTEIGGILGSTLAGVANHSAISGEVILENCVNNGAVSHYLGNGYSGGIAGALTAGEGLTSTMVDCVNNGTVTGLKTVDGREALAANLNDLHDAIGGIAGFIQNAEIASCMNNGEVSNNQLLNAATYQAQLRTGGIVGYAKNSSVNNSVNNGMINASTSGNAEVVGGGIAGVIEGSAISNSFSASDVNATDIAKAIAAVSTGSTLEENYRYGSALLNGAISKVNDPSTDDGGIYDAITVSFPGIEGVKVEYYDTSWKTLEEKVTDGAFYKMPDGKYTVRVSKGGMSYTFSNIVIAGEAVVLEVPVKAITVAAIDAEGAKLALVQSDWVYPAIEVATGEYSFPVFDNGRTYELRITEPGLPVRSIGTANSTKADGIWAGDTVPFRGENHYQGITVNFPGVEGVKVEYYGTAWTTVDAGLKDSVNFDLGPGKYTVRVSKGGMSYTFSNVQVSEEALVLNVPVLPISIKGIETDCQLALVQSDWVYRYTAVAPGDFEFLVFDNGRTYELRIQEQGQTRSIGTANSSNAEGIWAGDTVRLSNKVTITAEQYAEYVSNVKLWNNIYAWADGYEALFAEIANIYTRDSILAARTLLNNIADAIGGAHAQAIRDANGGQAAPPYWLEMDHQDMPYWYQQIKAVMDDVIAVLIENSQVELAQNAVPVANVTQQSGSTNMLTITVTEYYPSGRTEELVKTFEIKNNSSGTFEVGAYKVYVATSGNVKINACYIVD